MATSQLIQHLRDHLLTCAICEDIYLDPRTLQCLHSFCLRCIQRWSANKGGATGGETVQCPSCRHVTDLGPLGGGAEGLPKAFFLRTLHGIVQGYQDTLCGDDAPLQCVHCSASTVCKACNLYLCDHCAEKHRQDQTTREHRTIALPAADGAGGQQGSLRRERRGGGSQRLSRSASTGEQLGGITLQGLFRRSRSADRTKGSRNRTSDGAGGGGGGGGSGGGEANPANSLHGQLARCRYLSHPLSRFTIRGSGRSVWGVATLSHRIYTVTYCSSVIDVYDGASFDRIGSISVDGLKDPWDMVACRRRRCLYVADWKSKSVFAVHPGDYDDREVIRSRWLQMEHRPRGVSVRPDGDSVLVVCSDWRRREEASCESLRVYDGSGPKRPRVTRKVRLADLGSVWQAVQEPDAETYVVCHGGRWDRLHRVCRVDAEGRLMAVYGREPGFGRERMNIPASICVDSHGQILVADYSNSRVHLLNADLTLQRYLLSQVDGLDKPRRLCLDEDRGLLLVGQENGDIRIFTISEPKIPL